MSILSIDVETFSSTDLVKCGVYKYVEASDFEILLFAFAYDAAPITVLDLTDFETMPKGLMKDLINPKIIKAAYNANFERTCIAKHFNISTDPAQWRCTSVHALTLGLPGYLDGVAQVLGLNAQKDAAGKNLIKYFSTPCTPTKVNGGRTRNYPHHDPVKWQQYKDYNAQDVVVEREVRKKLEHCPVPEHEWRLWELDQRMNDVGVRLDPELVRQALDCSTQYTARLETEAKALTGLDNPNSVKQLTSWLEGQGLTVEDGLGKDFMPGLIEQADDDETKRALVLRQEMSKTSVDKYNAMDRCVCEDERARGLLQFYGANRTGRWAGRGIQIQNLPQNKIPDLELARQMLREGNFELLEMLFGSPPFVLSQLIRTAFIPSPGCRFIVSDFSAIEARVIAWLANEDWVLEVFRGHGKIYEATAAQMFHVGIDTIAKGQPNYALRAKGKVATLSCIASWQQVLTDKGLVQIEKVTRDHKIWDGVEFVEHDGVICRGIKEVIEYEGLTATPDHLVWIEGKSRPVQFGDAAASGYHLLCSGVGGHPVRVGRGYQSRETMESRLERCKGAYQMHKLRKRTVGKPRKLNEGKLEGVPSVLTAETDTLMAEPEIDSRKKEMHSSARSAIRKLRGQGDRIQIRLCHGSRFVGHRQSGITGSEHGDGQDRQQRSLRAGEHPICKQSSEFRESTDNNSLRVESKRLAVCSHCGYPNAGQGDDQGADIRRSLSSSAGQAQKLEANRGTAFVYDIINAGPRKRFTVSGYLVHNCGYQGGPDALVRMGALKSGLTEDELPGLVKGWRASNPHIVKLWYAAERAAITAMQERRTVKLAHGVQYRFEKGWLFADLPSGRSLAYVNPQLKYDPKFEKDGLTYEGMDQVTKTWCRQKTYGGKLVENLVQAIARDCLAVSMMRLDEAGYKIRLHVHDEVIIDEPVERDSIKDIIEIMGQPIDWAPGLPLRADAFETEFYKKD